MISMQSHIEDQLQLALEPEHCEVVNESSQHSGPATESHFKIVVVSSDFDEMKLIDRHRFINKLFSEELKQIHALPNAPKSIEANCKNVSFFDDVESDGAFKPLNKLYF